MPLSPAERSQLRKSCTVVMPGGAEPSPAEDFRRMAAWCEAESVAHDQYGDGPLVEGFEQKIATLLDMPAAVFMPSGVMAQGVALRIWTEAAGLHRVGLHPTSHLLLHEEQAWSALFGLHAVPLGQVARPLLAEDVAACRQPLACVITELPIRESGGRLPSWTDLQALKDLARERRLRLHLDGARLWESCAGFDRPPKEIAAGFDSVYVSFYKGIGALAGAMLLGDADFIAQARLWRRRLGGTLYHLSPMVVSAAMQFDERLARQPALLARARSLAEGLSTVAGLRVDPPVPHTNMLHLWFDAPADAVLDARDQIACETGCWLLGGLRAADVPGWSRCEWSVGNLLLDLADDQVLPLFERLCQAMRQDGGPV
jgi:threonine aldolase